MITCGSWGPGTGTRPEGVTPNAPEQNTILKTRYTLGSHTQHAWSLVSNFANFAPNHITGHRLQPSSAQTPRTHSSPRCPPLPGQATESTWEPGVSPLPPPRLSTGQSRGAETTVTPPRQRISICYPPALQFLPGCLQIARHPRLTPAGHGVSHWPGQRNSCPRLLGLPHCTCTSPKAG